MAENHVQPIVTAKASARMEFASAILSTAVWTVHKVSRGHLILFHPPHVTNITKYVFDCNSQGHCQDGVYSIQWSGLFAK